MRKFDIAWIDEEDDGCEYWKSIYSTDTNFIRTLYDISDQFKFSRVRRYKTDGDEYDTVQLYDSDIKELIKFLLDNDWEPIGQMKISNEDDDYCARYSFKRSHS